MKRTYQERNYKNLNIWVAYVDGVPRIKEYLKKSGPLWLVYQFKIGTGELISRRYI